MTEDWKFFIAFMIVLNLIAAILFIGNWIKYRTSDIKLWGKEFLTNAAIIIFTIVVIDIMSAVLVCSYLLSLIL